MSSRGRPLLPALAYHRLTGLYDVTLSRLLAEQKWKSRLVAQIAPRVGDVIIVLGAGSGTLAIMLKAACPVSQRLSSAV